MKPVLIFRHVRHEGAGYLAVFLEQQKIPWQEVRVDLGEQIPAEVNRYSGLVFMGGPMSVHDDLPWLAQEIKLIQQAFEYDVPVLGHCLGGQLMSIALGAAVTRNPVEEIGWGDLSVHDNADARKWFGDSKQFLGFHWHGETFALPDKAVRLLSSQYCENQAYAMGKHLAMQCHVEMTADLVKTWYQYGEAHIQASSSPAVQTKQAMLENLSERITQLNRQAHTVYTTWVAGLSD